MKGIRMGKRFSRDKIDELFSQHLRRLLSKLATSSGEDRVCFQSLTVEVPLRLLSVFRLERNENLALTDDGS
jgi:hypothetical protein